MERDMLALLQDTGLPVARLLGADLDAIHTDVPALLVSCFPGRLTYPQEPTVAFVAGMAQAAALVHAQPVPELGWPWNDRTTNLKRFVDGREGPGWHRLRASGIPQGPLTFLKGDLWPGTYCSGPTG